MWIFFPAMKKARKGRLGAVKARASTNYPFTSNELATATGDRLSRMLGMIADTACRSNLSKIPFEQYEDFKQEAILWMLKYSVPKLVVGSNAISFCYFAAHNAIKRLNRLRIRDGLKDGLGGYEHFADREEQNDIETEGFHAEDEKYTAEEHSYALLQVLV